MADKKHIEYCIKLGNTFMQEKLENVENKAYSQNYINEEPQANTVAYNEDFRTRLRKWQ